MPHVRSLQGKGLGLRRALMRALEEAPHADIDFLEAAPENWIDIGGALGRRLRTLCERRPLVCHGLSLNIGGPAPLDLDLVRRIKTFLDSHDARCYSEHLSYCADDGHLYDLLPIPCTAEAVEYVAARVAQVQDMLERRVALENVSCYCAPGADMSELEFINAVLERADCDLLLDINNVHVNSVNQAYDARAFLAGLPPSRIVYLHVAGHRHAAPDLIVDTHGAAVAAPVWELLREAYALFGALPTVLERDFNVPPLAELMVEVANIGSLQGAVERKAAAHA